MQFRFRGKSSYSLDLILWVSVTFKQYYLGFLLDCSKKSIVELKNKTVKMVVTFKNRYCKFLRTNTSLISCILFDERSKVSRLCCKLRIGG